MNRERPIRWPAIGMLVGVLLCAAFTDPPAAAGADEREWAALGLRRAPPGIRAPDFTLSDVDGRPLRLTDLRGLPVLLNFWATWCVPCEMEMGAIDRLQRRVGTADLVVLTVNFKEPLERVVTFVRERGLTVRALLDRDGRVSERYRVIALPFTVLVGRDGQVKGVTEGPRNWADDATLALIRRLVGETY